MSSHSQDQTHNSKAKPESMVIFGKARFTVLTPHVIRMEWDTNTVFTDKATLVIVNRQLPLVDFTYESAGDLLTIRTSAITLTYKNDGQSFHDGNLTVNYQENDLEIIWEPNLKNRGNLRGTRRTLDMYKGDRYLGLKRTELEEGIISKDGWYLLDESKSPEFEEDGLVKDARKKDVIDWYFFGYGLNYKRALLDYTHIAGKIPLPPKYVFGVWWSKWWPYKDSELKALVSDFEKAEIPLDVMIIDMDWHITKKSRPDLFKNLKQGRGNFIFRNGWTGFTWEKKYFPKPKDFLDWCKEQQIYTALNIHPNQGVMAIEDAYKSFATNMGLDPKEGKPIEYDITNPEFVKNYFDLLITPLIKEGIDFIWLDWQQWKNTPIKGLNNTFYLNHLHFNNAETFAQRPLIYHRWGGLGSHRYPVGFSGDTFIDWKSLDYQPYFTSTASNVCYGYWGHDIGGFVPNLPPLAANKLLGIPYDNSVNYELMTRWVQWGAFSPIFKTHASDIDEIERRIWKYPEPYFSIMKSAIRMRYDLLAYIYTYARMAYDTGVSLLRPLYYEFPEYEESYKFSNQYFFGDQLLIAPIVKPSKNNTVQHEVWLPPGKWYHYKSSVHIEGEQIYSATYELQDIPIFVKEGAIIVEHLNQMKANNPIEVLDINLYPGDKNNSFSLYEDNGNDQGYLKGQFAFTKIEHTVNNHSLHKLVINPSQGQYAGQILERSYRIALLGVKGITEIKINGAKGDFIESTTATNIEIAKMSTSQTILLEWEEVK